MVKTRSGIDRDGRIAFWDSTVWAAGERGATPSYDIAIESQVDLMAAAAGMDALAFRLLNLTDARMRRVLQAAAQAFGWTRAPAPSGRGFGVATMAEVKVDRATGKISVLRSTPSGCACSGCQ